MAFDLTIQFWGLCLFVPHPALDTVYVLMPAAGVPGGAGGMPPHLARLYVDPAYTRRGSARTDGELDEFAALERQSLSFAGPDAPSTAPLPAELANVGAVANQAITGAVLPGILPAPPFLTARIQLAAGSCSPPTVTECWAFPPGNPARSLTPTITWTISGIEQEPLSLTLASLDDGTERTLPPLYPIDGQIAVSVYHTEADDLPPAQPITSPPWGTAATHFSAYYLLFQAAAPAGPVPVSEPCDGSGRGGNTADVRWGEMPYTCMGPAQAALVP
ncbi:MAG TPA: hypothetical protein VFS20_31845 [Longimicrobium sp.]|nr:hypothetical protein [Longimicrobium sp.]